jgi:hypothetical protein
MCSARIFAGSIRLPLCLSKALHGISLYFSAELEFISCGPSLIYLQIYKINKSVGLTLLKPLLIANEPGGVSCLAGLMLMEEFPTDLEPFPWACLNVFLEINKSLKQNYYNYCHNKLYPTS